MTPADRDQALARLGDQVADYYRAHLAPAPFVPGETPVPVSGKVWDEQELKALLEASLDGWWTEGRFTQAVQLELSRFTGVRNVALCNSGSSANLLAFTALTSKLLGERRIVTLMGCVQTREQAQQLEQAVLLVDDVMGVVNLLMVGTKEEPKYRVLR